MTQAKQVELQIQSATGCSCATVAKLLQTKLRCCFRFGLLAGEWMKELSQTRNSRNRHYFLGSTAGGCSAQPRNRISGFASARKLHWTIGVLTRKARKGE